MGGNHAHGAPGAVDLAIPERRERLLYAIAIVLAAATAIGVFALRAGAEVETRANELGIQSERYKATVTKAERVLCSFATPDNPRTCLSVQVRMHQGPTKGEVINLGQAGELPAESPFAPNLSAGDKVIVGYEPSNDVYFYSDRDRRGSLWILTALFALAVIGLGRLRGIAALAALGATVVVMLQFIVPAVLAGRSPLAVAVFGSAAIAFIVLYVSTGLNVMTTVALLGTLAALALTAVLGWLFFKLASFTGGVSEESTYLRLATEAVDVRGLLLGGVVIGALGALDDMTVTQASAVWELRRANADLGRAELYRRALRIGRDHVGSTVNTLLLAYAGASMPLLLLFVLSSQSLGTVANSEIVALEIVRTLVGSIGLVAAVPITTALAAWAVSASPERAT